MKEPILKRIIIALLGLLIVSWGLFKLSVMMVITGVILFIIALTLRLKTVTVICMAVIKSITKAEIIKEVAKSVSEDLKESYPNISDGEIIRVGTASTLQSITASTTSIVSEHIKEVCSNCGSSDVKEIEWSSEFDRIIGREDIFNKHTFKCNGCGNVRLQYDSN